MGANIHNRGLSVVTEGGGGGFYPHRNDGLHECPEGVQKPETVLIEVAD